MFLFLFMTVLLFMRMHLYLHQPIGETYETHKANAIFRSTNHDHRL